MTEKSGEQAISRRRQAKNWITNNWFHSILIAIGGIIFLLMVIFPEIFPDRFGLGEIKNDSGEIIRAQKTVWDWLELLIVPGLLAAGAAWLGRQQQKRDLDEREVDREIADQAREAEREIALERQRQQTLENYLDRMKELLLDRRLGPKAKPKVKKLARTWTLNVLRELNAKRNRQVIMFLQESELLVKDKIVDLSGADLSGADLSGAYLYEAYLSGADLEGAFLIGAKLFKGDLIGAKLNEADLSGADLSGADLSWANLEGADLSEAFLIGTNLTEANLSGAILSGAYPSEANLSGANLSGANLSGAFLVGANLSEAEGWTEEQLLQARTLEDATMPDGRKYEEWIKDREGQTEEEAASNDK